MGTTAQIGSTVVDSFPNMKQVCTNYPGRWVGQCTAVGDIASLRFGSCYFGGILWIYRWFFSSFFESNKNIARGTTDPKIDSVTWIKFSNSITPLALVANLATRWRHLHQFSILDLQYFCKSILYFFQISIFLFPKKIRFLFHINLQTTGSI